MVLPYYAGFYTVGLGCRSLCYFRSHLGYCRMFTWLDYVVFLAALLAFLVMGVAFAGRQKTQAHLLIGSGLVWGYCMTASFGAKIDSFVGFRT